ncbi:MULTISPECIES: hypothetical protein [Streptomyces]|uniref:hypothetical protein n=1 Tax=Streptomyces TaxID=1883 RepID=UPI0019B17900|nr:MULTISPECIES: hypothetical protein [Streptomyces]GGS97437.1 hypothetical protein GCM10010286_22990 [Streptomyces toxytricini]
MDGSNRPPLETGFFDGLIDIPGMIVNAITSFLGMLVEQIMKPVRELLAGTLLSTPDITQHADIKRLWAGSVGIYVLFVMAGGVTVMGHQTVQSRYAVKQIAPRLVLGLIVASSSLTVMGKAISLANAMSHAVMGTDMSDAGKGLVERVIQIPGWCTRVVFRSTPISTQLPAPLRMLQSVAMWRLVGHFLPGASALGRRGGRGWPGGHRVGEARQVEVVGAVPAEADAQEAEAGPVVLAPAAGRDRRQAGLPDTRSVAAGLW